MLFMKHVLPMLRRPVAPGGTTGALAGGSSTVDGAVGAVAVVGAGAERAAAGAAGLDCAAGLGPEAAGSALPLLTADLAAGGFAAASLEMGVTEAELGAGVSADHKLLQCPPRC